jgi:hypothetical protein
LLIGRLEAWNLCEFSIETGILLILRRMLGRIVAGDYDKAAVRALAQLKHDELKDRGIFVGSVMPCGVIGSNEHFAPANIAECYWEIVSRRDEVELRYE